MWCRVAVILLPMPPAVSLMHKNRQRCKIIHGMHRGEWMKQTWNCNKLTTSIQAKNWIWCPINTVYLFSLLVIPIFFYEFMSDEIYQICFHKWQNLMDSAGDLITISCFFAKKYFSNVKFTDPDFLPSTVQFKVLSIPSVLFNLCYRLTSIFDSVFLKGK